METKDNEIEIMTGAVALGEAISNSAVCMKYIAAKEAYEKDEHVTELVGEFHAEQNAMSAELAKDGDDRDDETIRKLNERLNAIYEEITENEVYSAFECAQTEFSELLKKVNDIILQCATGEGGCSGNCSSCHGCE